jgi:hypothetical protein
MSRLSKFRADLASYEADHKEVGDTTQPQIKGRTAILIIVGLLLCLAALTYFAMEAPMHPRKIDLLESVLFGIAALVGALRIHYARKH